MNGGVRRAKLDEVIAAKLKEVGNGG